MEKQMEKQMGCMAGLFQLFDRNQIGKRLPPPPPTTPSNTENDSRRQPTRSMTSASQTPPAPVDIPTPPKSPLPLRIFELSESSKHSSWKFSPRLSLDSRATFDAAKGGLKPREIRTNATNRCDNNLDESNHGSPSVIARLMGLDPLPNKEATQAPQLRRCASESRVCRDIFQQHLTQNNNNNNSKSHIYTIQNSSTMSSNVIREQRKVESCSSKIKAVNKGFKPPQERKSFFDSADFFPEPKQRVPIEKRSRMRGIDEPSNDLETLKQILEAMQLKGLLHSNNNNHPVRINHFVCDPTVSTPPSPTLLMKPNSRSKSGGIRRKESQCLVSDQKSASSPTRKERVVKNGSSNVSVGRKHKRLNEYAENGRVSPPLNSPRISPNKRNVVDQVTANRSPRNRKPIARINDKGKIRNVAVVEDESCSSISTQTDNEMRSKAEVDYKQGRRLLERCDKLLHTIAEMNEAELQPSPISVLDSSFYKDESSSSSPSPVMKQSVSFTDESVELEEDLGSPGMSSIMSNCEDENSDPDLVYISEILRALRYASEETDDIFLRLEKQQYLKGNDTSKVSRLQRKLIFETITEVLNRKRQEPISKALFAKHASKPSIGEIWSEFQKIRERERSEDLFEIVCGVLKKDLARDAINGWIGCPVEISEAVLDIERLIFKDLVGESIRDLAEFAGKTTMLAPRRKLVF